MKHVFVSYLLIFLGIASVVNGRNVQEDTNEITDLQAEQNYTQYNTNEWNVIYIENDIGEDDLQDTQNYQVNNNTVIDDPHRIVGGEPIAIVRTPYQVAIFIDGSFSCGGSIISVKWVLTAAHCIRKAKYVVRVGSRFRDRGGEGRRIRLIVKHGGFNSNTFQNDIAMLLVGRRFNFGRKILPIPLATPRDILPRPGEYFVSGWGQLRSNGRLPFELRGVTVRALSKSACRQRYKGLYNVHRTQLCAASPGRDACQGDSGGPLVNGGKLFGIVSTGIGCADYPGVYTDLRYYKGWIVRVAKRFMFV